MTYQEILQIADRGYRKAADDGGMLVLIDEETGEVAADADSLALAIGFRLTEILDYTNPPQTVLTDAIHEMVDLRRLINGVIGELETEWDTQRQKAFPR